MDIRLTRELEAYIRKHVKSGLYRDAAEVIGEALRGMRENERARASHLADLKQKTRAGLKEARQGRFVDGPKLVRKWETRLQEIRKRKRA